MTRQTKQTLFTSRKETWDADEADEIVIKLDPAQSGSGTTVKIEEKFFVLTGTETVEQFLIWWKDYVDKIMKKDGLSHANKLDILKRIVRDEARNTFDLTMDQTGSDVDRHGWKWKIARNKMKELAENGLTDS